MIIRQLAQPQLRFANWNKALVESNWTFVTMVTCDTF